MLLYFELISFFLCLLSELELFLSKLQLQVFLLVFKLRLVCLLELLELQAHFLHFLSYFFHLVFEFFVTIFDALDVQFELLLDSNVLPYVRLQVLNQLFVDRRNLRALADTMRTAASFLRITASG